MGIYGTSILSVLFLALSACQIIKAYDVVNGGDDFQPKETQEFLGPYDFNNNEDSVDGSPIVQEYSAQEFNPPVLNDGLSPPLLDDGLSYFKDDDKEPLESDINFLDSLNGDYPVPSGAQTLVWRILQRLNPELTHDTVHGLVKRDSSNALNSDDIETDQDDINSYADKRSRFSHNFVGKRRSSHAFVGKRGYSHAFVGKRGYSHAFVGKRGYSHAFVGKRAPGSTHSFIGKRTPETDELENALKIMSKRAPGFSHNFVGKRGYSHSFVGKRLPGFVSRGTSHSFVGKRGYSHSFVGKRGYSHSFVGKRVPGYSHNFVGKRIPGSTHNFVGKRGFSHSFVGKRAPGYSHNFVGKRAPGYTHSFVGKRGYSHAFVGKRSFGRRGSSHMFVGKRAPGFSHNFVGKRAPAYSHNFVGKRYPGSSHSFVGKRGDENVLLEQALLNWVTADDADIAEQNSVKDLKDEIANENDDPSKSDDKSEDAEDSYPEGQDHSIMRKRSSPNTYPLPIKEPNKDEGLDIKDETENLISKSSSEVISTPSVDYGSKPEGTASQSPSGAT